MYNPKHYKEYADVKQSKIHLTGNQETWNAHGFMGNAILDVIVQQTKWKILALNIFSQSGDCRHDASAYHCNKGKVLFEVKMRWDNDHIKYPKTCLGEKIKYDYLKEEGKSQNATPFLINVHSNGEVNIININKVREPKWVLLPTQRSMWKRDEVKNVWIGKYYKNDPACITLHIPEYDKLVTYLFDEFTINNIV